MPLCKKGVMPNRHVPGEHQLITNRRRNCQRSRKSGRVQRYPLSGASRCPTAGEKSIDAFFRRIKEGKTPGYPSFQGYGRYDSFTYPQSGFSLTEDNRVCLSKIGTIKVKLPKGKKAHPPIGEMKTCTIKREGQHWFIVFTCEVEQDIVYHPSEETIGIDLGLLHFATLSDGSTIENPRHLRTSEHKAEEITRGARSQKAWIKASEKSRATGRQGSPAYS